MGVRPPFRRRPRGVLPPGIRGAFADPGRRSPCTLGRRPLRSRGRGVARLQPHAALRRSPARVLVPALLALVFSGCSGGFAGPGPTSVGTVGGGYEAAGSGVTLTVSAASDLAVALDELGRRFTEQTGVAVVVNLGSSGQLAQQIERGAPVDVFFSADREYVDELVEKGIVSLEDTALYGLGRLTLWTRAVNAVRVETLSDLTDPAVKRIAIANPDHAPYGRAARQALQSAGLWEDLQSKIVMAENVLQALQFADSGNADVALIARSLSVQGDGRWTLVPAELHRPIEQTLAVISQSPNVAWGRRFAEFVTGSAGRPILDSYGFVLP